MSSITSSSIENIKQFVDNAVKDSTNDVPGASVVVINKQGKVLLNYAAGKQGLDKGRGDLTTDSIYFLASCTKFASIVLALIAVEEGKLTLDDPKVIEKLCPELRSIPIIQDVSSDGKVTLVPKKTKITLRMLLNNTAGFSYTHLNKNLTKYGRLFGIHEGNGSETGILQPLIAEPGTRWSYGIGIDWACNAITRAYKSTLEDLMQQKIFEPLGIKDTSFIPTQSMKDRTVTCSFRTPKGNLVPLPRNSSRAQNSNEGWAASGYQFGGSGLYSNPSEYIKLFSTMLNKGVSPHTGKRILSEKSVDEIFTNQIPHMPNFGRDYPMTSSIASVSNSLPEVFYQPGNPPQGWGFSIFLNLVPTPTGRSKNSGYWCGIYNLFYWIDREKGITGFVSSQILPFGDEKMMNLVDKVEAEVYNGLVPFNQPSKL